MGNDVITIRISDEIIQELRKVHGDKATTSEMIRHAIGFYIGAIDEVNKEIAYVKVPIKHLTKEEIRNIYNVMCETEKQLADRLINTSETVPIDQSNIEALEVIQKTKNNLLDHITTKTWLETAKKQREELKEKIRTKQKEQEGKEVSQ